MTSPDRVRALVTGASSGIGAAFAREIAAQGHDLIITARRGDRLEALASQLSADTGVDVRVIVADLSLTGDLEGLEEVVRSDERLSLLVNNAGFGAYQPFVDLEPEVLRNLISVNVVAIAHLARAAIPGMLERGGGSMINMASLLAFSGLMPAPPLPFRATYAAAKSFIITFSQMLAGEVAGTGVDVMACCPGVVTSEFHEVQGMDVSAMPHMAAEDVVTAAFKGLELGETICCPGLEDATLLDDALQGQLKVMFAGAGPGSSGGLASRYRSGGTVSA